MPTKKEFEGALELVSQCVQDIGDEIESGLDARPGITFGGGNTEGFWCKHGSASYAIVGKPNQEFFQIIYPRLVLGNIAERLDEDAVDDLLSEYSEKEIEQAIEERRAAKEVRPEDITEGLIEQLDIEMSITEIKEADELPEELDDMYLGGEEYLASEEWLYSLESGLMQDIKYHLREKLSSADVAYGLIPENDDIIYGFQVSKSIFPYEEEFRLKEFNDCVQATISVGVAGNNFLTTTFGLEDELTTPSLPNV